MSSPRYRPLSQKESDVEHLGSKYRVEERQRKFLFTWKRLLVVLAMSAVLQCAYLPVKHFTRRPTTRRMRLGTPCHASHYNHSSIASLPTHYTLPSGDKIPSVALGTRSMTSVSTVYVQSADRERSVSQESGRLHRTRSDRLFRPR